MRVTRDQLVNGIVSFVENDVIPKVEERPMRVIMGTAIYAIRANSKLLDSVFEHPTIKALLDKDDEGLYETEVLFRALGDSMKKYGSFPVIIPPIPFVSPTEKTLTFNESDISELITRIERSA